jgi:Zn-dependent peptidase ImmA (M78 family)
MFPEVKKKINEIFERFNITHVPIPVEDIAKDLDIKISYAPSEEYSGILIRKEDGGTLMGINSLENPSRMRFTIAHELGHFLLEKTSVSIDYRSNHPNETKTQQEKKADFFAANLLMPENFLREDFKTALQNRPNVFLEEDLNKLATRYEVSKEAMKYRLMNLKLL